MPKHSWGQSLNEKNLTFSTDVTDRDEELARCATRKYLNKK